MRVLNLYAGIGGNRKLWQGHLVTAVEWDAKIREVYSELYPHDTVVGGDAHAFLKENFGDFDFIWSSPPCQSHSKMDRVNSRNKPRYPDLRLYEEILFLQTYCKHHPWVVENVKPYYTPLVQPSCSVGRHLFWSNFEIWCNNVPSPKSFIASGKKQASAQDLKDWLAIQFDRNLYYGDNHCPAQR